MPQEDSHFSVGSIVALKSHPFTSSDNNIFIGGESQHVSPLLVVIEVLKNTKDNTDKSLKFQLQQKKITYKCKCLWFSTKLNQFEEDWLSSDLLKLIPLDEEQHARKLSNLGNKDFRHKIHLGDLVTLNTSYLEIKKQKLIYSSEQNKESIKPIYSFICPILQIIGLKEVDLVNTKQNRNSKIIHLQSDLLIKCKWYNSMSGKMSEKYIPIEALQIIDQIDENKLCTYVQMIKQKNIIHVTINGINTIILPHKIKHINGYYFVIAYDYLYNCIKKYEINKLELNQSTSHTIIKRIPNIETSKPITLQIEEVFSEYKFNYIRIKYLDKTNRLTYRTVKNFHIMEFGDSIPKQKFLVSFCMLRNDIRHFNLERILCIEILALTF